MQKGIVQFISALISTSLLFVGGGKRLQISLVPCATYIILNSCFTASHWIEDKYYKEIYKQQKCPLFEI
jgi:hypothetical protein